MARGRRSGRTGASGGPASAGDRAVPENIETVDYEELPDRPAASAQGAAPASAGPDTGRMDVMAEPEEAREPVAPATTEAAPPPRRGGFLPGLIGGLLGGAAVVGGGGWYAYEKGPIKPALEQLESTAAATKTAEGGIATLSGRVDEIGTSVGGLGNDLGGTKAALQQADSALAALGQKVDAAEAARGELTAKLDQVGQAIQAASEQTAAQLQTLGNKLVEVQQAQPADIVDKKTVDDIGAKQAAIEQSQKTIADGLVRLEQLVAHSLEAGNQQAAALRSVVDATRVRVDELVAAQRELMPLKDAIAQQQAVDQQHTAALAETGNQMAGVRSDVEQKLTDVTARLSALDAARERAVGIAVAAQGLGTALESGQPFGPTLEAMTQLGQNDPVVSEVVAKLQPMAAEGVPTFSSLARSLGEVERSLEPTKTAPADDWLSRTQENLGNLINLHAADAEDVPGQAAVQAAVQAMLLQDLSGAVAALKPLTESGNESAKAWVARAEQRLGAITAVDDLRQHVKNMLTGQG